MRNWTRRVCASALCILCLLALFPVRAAAAGAIDTSRDVRLTIEYRHDRKPVASVPFELYYVASVDAYASFTLAGDFAAYPVTLENLPAAEWTAANALTPHLSLTHENGLACAFVILEQNK